MLLLVSGFEYRPTRVWRTETRCLFGRETQVNTWDTLVAVKAKPFHHTPRHTLRAAHSVGQHALPSRYGLFPREGKEDVLRSLALSVRLNENPPITMANGTIHTMSITCWRDFGDSNERLRHDFLWRVRSTFPPDAQKRGNIRITFGNWNKIVLFFNDYQFGSKRCHEDPPASPFAGRLMAVRELVHGWGLPFSRPRNQLEEDKKTRRKIKKEGGTSSHQVQVCCAVSIFQGKTGDSPRAPFH